MQKKHSHHHHDDKDDKSDGSESEEDASKHKDKVCGVYLVAQYVIPCNVV